MMYIEYRYTVHYSCIAVHACIYSERVTRHTIFSSFLLVLQLQIEDHYYEYFIHSIMYCSTSLRVVFLYPLYTVILLLSVWGGSEDGWGWGVGVGFYATKFSIYYSRTRYVVLRKYI